MLLAESIAHTWYPLQIALYAYPLGWLALFFVSLFSFSISYVSSYLSCQDHQILCELRFRCVRTVLQSTYRFLPIVILALVFNMSNVLGFTYVHYRSLPPSKPVLRADSSLSIHQSYADRDSKRRWANSALSSGLGGGLDILPFGLGGVGAQLVGGAVRSGLGRVFG